MGLAEARHAGALSIFGGARLEADGAKLVGGAAEGVQIFIGAGNELFRNAGFSMIVAPFTNSAEKIVGAIGVIGPTRLNYARIIPMVDYTAKVIGRLVG